MALYSYAEKFESILQQKYEQELTSYALTRSNQQVKFLNAQTIKLPRITVSGYKDHNRASLGFNAGAISNDWEPKKLEHDRDIELFIDPMDVDETNLVAEMANVQNVFEEEQAIPEKDSYRYSKLFAEANTYKTAGAVIDTTSLDATTILKWFDEQMEIMNDKGVPTEGRMLYLTPAMNTLIKNAQQIQRNIDVRSAGGIDRRVMSLDNVTFQEVPSARFKTVYDFSDGCVPAPSAKQINMMLVHPSCVISRDKYAYMQLFTPGHDSRTADKYLYQNRYYTDTFLIERKACGVAINVEGGE